MPNGVDHRDGAGAKQAHRASASAGKPALYALGERWLRPADQLDRLIRRWVVPHDPLAGSVIRASVVTKPIASSTSTSVGKQFMPGEGLMAIGRYLRAEYDLQQPIPARLVSSSANLKVIARNAETVSSNDPLCPGNEAISRVEDRSRRSQRTQLRSSEAQAWPEGLARDCFLAQRASEMEQADSPRLRAGGLTTVNIGEGGVYEAVKAASRRNGSISVRRLLQIALRETPR